MESEKNKEKGYKLLESSKSGDLEMVKFLIEKEEVDINFTDKDGYTALDHAALNGNLIVVNYLAKRELHIGTKNIPKRFTMPLYYSIFYSHIDVAKFLIQNGARSNAVLQNENLLDIAILSNKPEMIGLLLENSCAINQYNPRGITPLSQALRLAKYDSVAFLLEKGADYRKLSVKENFSPLHYSIHGQSAEEKGTGLVKLLLNHVEKKEGKIKTIEYVNHSGSTSGGTALHEACRMRSYNVVKLLLQYGADRNLKDKKGNKPYDLLYKSDHTNVCKQIRALFDLDKQQQHSR